MRRLSSIDALGMKNVFTTNVLVKPRKIPAMMSASRYSRNVLLFAMSALI
jgi:hypothetical protein